MDETGTRLPVTGEVGGEGGSYADSTLQRATFADERGLERTEDHGGPSSVATQATRSATVAAGGLSEAPGPRSGMRRYAHEEPAPTGAGQQRRTRFWRSGLRGVAAGAGAMVAAALLARRR